MTEAEEPATAAGGRRARRAERSDSLRNRDLLIATAREVFAAEGLNAPLDHVASRAGVGSGTLYRHFPNRAALWEAVLEDPLRAQLRLAEDALTASDAWTGLSAYLLATCEAEAEGDGYLELMTTRFDKAPALLEIRRAVQRAIEAIVARALAEKAVRPDFTTEDLLFLALSNSRIAEATRHVAPRAWRRSAELFLDAIRPERAHPLSVGPLRPSQVDLVVRRDRPSGPRR